MSTVIDVYMEVRPQDAEWDPTAQDAYVVRLTDEGWKHFYEHGFPAECRVILDDASSLMFLDFEDRANFVTGREMRRRLSLIQKSQRKILDQINTIFRTPSNQYFNDLSLFDQRQSIEASIRLIEDLKKGPWYRLNRDPVYNYVERLRSLTSVLGRPLTRSKKPELFLKKTLDIHAEPLLKYLTQIAKISNFIAENQVSLLRQQRSETAIRRRGADI